MKILITGANGLLGQKLAALLDQDHSFDLVATSKGPSRVNLIRSRYRTLDITSAQDVTTTMTAEKPGIVINTAAMTQVDQCETDRDACWESNVTAVEYLVAACEKINAHLIHISTDFIFDGSAGPLDESATPNPVNFYGESKLAGERVIIDSRLNWCILRTVLVYGVTPDQSRSNIVLWVKKSLEEGKTINVVNDQWRTPTLAEDLAMGCMLAAKKRAKGIYNISSETMMTPYEMAIATAKHFGLDATLIHRTDSTKFTQPAKRPPKTGFVITKAKNELGYQPHTFSEGLQHIDIQSKAFHDKAEP